MKTSLFKLFWEKEVIWAARMKEMKSKTSWPMFIILLTLIFIGQHAFALMHLLFESCLFVFNNQKFKNNLKIMQLKVAKQQIQYNIIKYNLIEVS